MTIKNVQKLVQNFCASPPLWEHKVIFAILEVMPRLVSSPAIAEILKVQFILHWRLLLKPEIEFKIIEPGDRWFYPL